LFAAGDATGLLLLLKAITLGECYIALTSRRMLCLLIHLYSLLFSFFSGFDYIFKQTYKLSDGPTGTCFASITLVATAFTLLAPGFCRLARRKTEFIRGSSTTPEFRLWPAILTAPLRPIALQKGKLPDGQGKT
jgi:hypothetical protein